MILPVKKTKVVFDKGDGRCHESQSGWFGKGAGTFIPLAPSCGFLQILSERPAKGLTWQKKHHFMLFAWTFPSLGNVMYWCLWTQAYVSTDMKLAADSLVLAQSCLQLWDSLWTLPPEWDPFQLSYCPPSVKPPPWAWGYLISENTHPVFRIYLLEFSRLRDCLANRAGRGLIGGSQSWRHCSILKGVPVLFPKKLGKSRHNPEYLEFLWG